MPVQARWASESALPGKDSLTRLLVGFTYSRNDVFNHMSVYVRQSHVATTKTVSAASMIHAH